MSKAHSTSLFAIVLAAGGSKRFGTPKQLAQLRGASLIQHAIAAASAVVGPRIRVVLGAYAAEIAPGLGLQEEQIVVNLNWAEGIASSIRSGIAHLPASCMAVLILLADQPQITSASLGRLVGAWTRKPDSIVASRFESVIGAPCVFPRFYFAELAALRGDQGARRLLERHFAHIEAVDHPEAAIDVDTPQQLAEQQRFFASDFRPDR